MKDVTLRIDYFYGFESKSKVAAFDIDFSESFVEREAFNEKIELLSDGASICDKMLFRPTTESEVKKIMANRKMVAEKISREMVDFLMEEFSKRDTLDGY